MVREDDSPAVHLLTRRRARRVAIEDDSPAVHPLDAGARGMY